MKILPAIITVAFLSIIWPFSVKAFAAQWPVFHGDQARTGFSSSKAPSYPEILWEITTDDLKKIDPDERLAGAAVIDQNKVFFTGRRVFAVDLHSGKFIWNYKDEGVDFYPFVLAAGENKIFITVNSSGQLSELRNSGVTGAIYAVDEKDGKFLWQYPTKKSITNSNPVVVEGKVFVGDDSGIVYALDASTGKLIWQKQLEAYQIHSSPAYDNGVIYVGTETEDVGGARTGRGSYMCALDAQDGKVLWQFESDWRSNEMPNLIHGTPAVLDGVVYFGSENGYFYALNKNDGSLIWKKIITKGVKTSARQARSTGLVGISTAPALGYGKIFIGTWEGNFLALDQRDGKTLWEYAYGTEGTNSSAVLADHKVYLGAYFGDFYCFDEATGRVIWKEKLGGPSAALADGILVVSNNLAAGNPGERVIVAFSDKGVSTATPITSILSLDNRNLQIVFILIFGLFLGTAAYKLIKSGRITVKQLLIYGGILLTLIIAGFFIYRYYSHLQWTETQTQLINEGKIDPATGSFISDDGIKYVEYQGKRYLLDGEYCTRSRLGRFAITVKRFNGVASADGQNGNTMYAIGSKDSPEYIDTKNVMGSNEPVAGPMRDCWKREAQ